MPVSDLEHALGTEAFVHLDLVEHELQFHHGFTVWAFVGADDAREVFQMIEYFPKVTWVCHSLVWAGGRWLTRSFNHTAIEYSELARGHLHWRRESIGSDWTRTCLVARWTPWSGRFLVAR